MGVGDAYFGEEGVVAAPELSGVFVLEYDGDYGEFVVEGLLRLFGCQAEQHVVVLQQPDESQGSG